MEQDEPLVFKVTYNGQERKAFDALGLKRFIEAKKYEYSILSIDPGTVEDKETLLKYLARASSNVLAELELALDQTLGLINTPESKEPVDDSEETEDSEVELEEKIDVSDDAPVSEEDEKIVL